MNSLHFYNLIWLLAVLPFASVQASFSRPATAANIAKPGCPRKCGNVTIPYPFGVGKGCFMGDEYEITCYREGNVSTPQFRDTTSEVLRISETQLLLAAGPVASSCNSANAGDENVWGGLDVTSLPYALSPTSNKFVVTGCYHYGLMEAQAKGGRQLISCVALCTKEMDLLDRTCSGIGCCQIPIPRGLRKFDTRLEKIFYEGNISSGNCSYAFIAENSSFKYHGAIDLRDPKFAQRVENLPVLLDWFVMNKTCKDAQRNKTTFACQKNTDCLDMDQVFDVEGYRCTCRQGFEGNPYLSPGCTDIKECNGPENPCSDNCVNTEGSYICDCPSGYHGDGLKNGTGCRPRNLKSIFILGLGIGLGSVLSLLAMLWLLVVARRRKAIMQRAKNFKKNGGLLLQQQMSSKEGLIDKAGLFSADELEKATDHFNVNRVLGKGGQGTVYKGMLSDGRIVAIKKSVVVNDRQLEQFINEVVILSQINHRNIVKLLGCCLETEVPLLVYEYIPNGTLSELIHDPNEDFPITWAMRLRIAIDVGGALNYLHSASSTPIFHRDVKTSNILLDEKYRAKVSDFGTSRSIAIDQTHLTTRVQGTFGYLDPEYFISSQFTEKSDVYSFGVVLVELLTGQKAIRASESSSGESLVYWFLTAMENSNLDNILAIRVANEGRKETVDAVAELAKKCLNMTGKERPTMREVAFELEVISQLYHEPVSCQNNPPEVVYPEITAEVVRSTCNDMLPSSTSFTEEECSLPST